MKNKIADRVRIYRLALKGFADPTRLVFYLTNHVNKTFKSMKKILTTSLPLPKLFVLNGLILLCFGFMPVHSFATIGSKVSLKKVTTTIKGTVTDAKNEPLIGATVSLKNSKIGAVTDIQGRFELNVPDNATTLVVSFIGYVTREIPLNSQTNLTIVLEEDAAALDEVVVTGVFDKRTRMESSVAISVLNAKLIQMQAPLSAADLLKNVSGVFVNSATGEIRNTVTSRGVTTGGIDGSSGYYYVSMQEDGLPVFNGTYGTFGPDYFLRSDITTAKLEAVKGGTASILGNNAPGGIFNYVSKTGGTTFAGEARVKYGLEGNGKNPYYRTELNFGGPLSKDKSLTYNIGGFWRLNDGARYSGYPMNEGGQIKANIVKNFKNSTLKIYGKYMNDKNTWFEYLPTVDFKNPHLAPGIEQTQSVTIPPVQAEYTINDTGEKRMYDSRDKIHSIDKSISAIYNTDFGNGWTFENKAKYGVKSSNWNVTSVPYPIRIDDVTWYGLNNLAPKFGLYSFNDLATGKNLINVVQGLNFVNGVPAGLKFTVANGSLPGAEVMPNALIFNPLVVFENKGKEFINQASITKKLKNMSFTGGVFYSVSDINRKNPSGVGTMYSQITSPLIKPTAITYTDATGNVYQITNPDGITGGMGRSVATSIFDVKQTQLAGYVGHNWAITPKLNLDWGLRLEKIRVKGTNQIATQTAATDGGADKNPLTLYDNYYGKITKKYSYDKPLNTVSFSGGVNYMFNDGLAVYARYSQGSKSPDLSLFLNVSAVADERFINPIAQNIQQMEAGFKLKKGSASLFVTPFYSILSNVPQQVQGQETSDVATLYVTDVLYNKYQTKGIEFEANYGFTKSFNLRAVATIQKSIATDYNTWNIGGNGKADDKVVSYSGNETDNNARVMLRISPSYTTGKCFGSIDWSYMGSRYANVANVFKLPAFNQSNLNLGYNISKKIMLQANINNLFNQNGVMSWAAPGSFPASLNTQGFTKAQLEGNPNAVYYTLSLPPRAYFMTLSFKF